MASQTWKEVTRIIQPRQASSSTSGEVGTHRSGGSNSVSGLLSTLIPVFIFAAVALLLFLVLRKTYNRVYTPRTYIGVLQEQERTPKPQKGGFFGWVPDYWALPDTYVLNHQSIDGYLFLRFFKLLIIICLAGICITWPILFPVNATGNGGESGLELLSFSNVVNPNRYYAHCVVAWIYLSFVMFAIMRETVFYINLRQAYLLSPRMASRISSRTVLFTSVPDYYLHQGRLRAVFQDVKQLWITTDCGELEELVEDRDQTAFKLEDAEVTLSKTANKKRLKNGESHGKAEEWISQKDRPTHKLKPIIGQKVDTIDWCRSHLKSIIPQIERMQAAHREGEVDWIPAVFIEFYTQRAAQAAFQQVVHHKALHFSTRAIGSTPDDIIWKNLGISEWQHIARTYAAAAVVVALTLFWSPITAFIGVLTNINYLTEQVPFLGFINNIPPAILGVITGLLPTLLLALLILLFPILCRILARLAGEVTFTGVELQTQSWYFIFQVIQVFLITTFTSGAASVAAQIVSNPTAAPRLLAQNLPKASNFYISYFILYGLAQTALKLLSMAGILTIILLSSFLDKTPRKKYNRWINLTGLQWGSEYPKWTNLGVIAIAYSCIAPLVLGFACLGFLFLYLAFRYNFLYVYTTTIDTRGVNYGRALQQLTTGVYLAEICLIGLFAIGTSGSVTSSGPLILMIIFLIATIVLHITARSSLQRLARNLPLTLEVEAEEEYEAHRNLEAGSDKLKTNGFSYDGSHPQDFNSKGQYRSSPIHGTKRPKPMTKGRKDSDTTGDQSSFFTTFFNPKKWTTYEQLCRSFRSDLYSQPVPPYPAGVERDAYLHPAIKSPTPQLWIVHDEMGISAREIHDTQSIIPITDEGAYFDEKNNVVWDQDHIEKAPLWDEETRIDY